MIKQKAEYMYIEIIVICGRREHVGISGTSYSCRHIESLSEHVEEGPSSYFVKQIKLAQILTLLICMPKVPGSNLGQDTDYPD
jgi:hypothetical protein